MPGQIVAVVEGRADPMPGTTLLWLQAPVLAAAAPGQFVMLRAVDGADPFLRLPLPLHRLTPTGAALLAHRGDAAYPWVAAARVGQRLDLLGPFGCALKPPTGAANLGLLAGASGLAPLLAILDRHSGGAQLVTLAPTARQCYPRELLPAGTEYASYVGAAQEPAFWESATRLVAWADWILASGSDAFYRQLRQVVERARILPPDDLVHVWVERPFACGAGICGACLVLTRSGVRHACTDGPFMPLAQLALE